MILRYSFLLECIRSKSDAEKILTEKHTGKILIILKFISDQMISNSYLVVQDLRDKEAGRWSKARLQSGRSRKIYTIVAKMHPSP